MKTIVIPFALFLFSMFIVKQEYVPTTPPQEKATVALLGVFHFAGHGDLAGIVMDDVQGEKRQKEIVELVEKLKQYKPTKVLLESSTAKNADLQLNYQSYLEGAFQLSSKERHQLGFRLAKAMNHDSIFGIDYKLNLPFDKIAAYCQEHEMMPAFQAIIDKAKNYTSGETKVLAEMNLSQFLIRMNNDQMDRFGNSFYLKEVLEIGDVDNPVGAEVVATWYKRNMIMFQNITSHVSSKQERILVIVGASHRAIIKDFIKNREDLDYFEISEVLQ